MGGKSLAQPDWAFEAVDDILADLNDRAGMDTCDIDDEIMEKIREQWAALIRGTAEKYGLTKPGESQ